MPQATRAGTTIHWREFGSGPAPALLLHCGQGRGSMWRGIADRIGAGHRMIAPDFPGHGRSGPWPEGRPVHDAATDMAAEFLTDGGHVIGHSFGATVALRAALAAPHRIARLTLIEPVLFAAARGSPEAVEQARAEASYTRACADGDHLAAARHFNRLWGAGTRWHDIKPETRDRMAASISFILAANPALHDDAHGLLAPGGIETLTMPVTLIRGAKTQPVIPAIHAALGARLPNARDIVIDGAGHMAPVTHPAEVAQAIVA